MRSQALTSLAALLVLVGCCVCGSRAQAQQAELPRPRSGYYLAAGLSGALNQAWQEDGPDRLAGGTAFALRFGQMLTTHLGLGLRLSSGGARAGALQSQFVAIGLEGQWEFARHLALRAGAGLGIAVVKDTADPEAKQKGTVGGGYSLALSYDWFPGGGHGSGGFAIMPVLEARLVPGSKVSALTGLFGLEFSYWTGLPRDELILPENEAYRPR